MVNKAFEESIQELADLIVESQRIVVFTGRVDFGVGPKKVTNNNVEVL